MFSTNSYLLPHAIVLAYLERVASLSVYHWFPGRLFDRLGFGSMGLDLFGLDLFGLVLNAGGKPE